eukprot:3279211-Heterocapsa_arctica.AAC.2
MEETGEHVWTDLHEVTPDDYVMVDNDTEDAATQLALDTLIENGVSSWTSPTTTRWSATWEKQWRLKPGTL